MSIDADTIVDRRRLRRKLTYWRIFAFLLIVIGVAGGVYGFYGRSLGLTAARPGAFIARVTIEGLIRSDPDRVEALDRHARSQASAVILHVNSPGGTTAGSEQLHDALRRLGERKPVVV